MIGFGYDPLIDLLSRNQWAGNYAVLVDVVAVAGEPVAGAVVDAHQHDGGQQRRRKNNERADADTDTESVLEDAVGAEVEPTLSTVPQGVRAEAEQVGCHHDRDHLDHPHEDVAHSLGQYFV
jgi:hypothetical protein